jgi:putative endonuclease
MKYYVYILLTKNNTLYTGITTDVLRRFEEHKTSLKGAKYTKVNTPKEIVYVEEFIDKSSASKEEYRIKKTLTRKEKLELIEKNSKKTKEFLKSFC